MKNAAQFQNVVQFLAQCFYISAAYFLFGQQRPLYILPSMFFLILFLEKMYWKKDFDFKFNSVPLSVAMCNSIYLNIDVFANNLYIYLLAVLVAFGAKYFLRVKNRPIFNPSVLAILVIALCFPMYATTALDYWKPNNYMVVITFVLGIITSTLAGSFLVSISYIVSYIVTSIVTIFVLKTYFYSTSLSGISYILWPSTLLSVGNALFIFHVLTDPKTSPKSKRGQLIFGALIGLSEFISKFFLIFYLAFVVYAFLMLIHAWYTDGANEEAKTNPLLA